MPVFDECGRIGFQKLPSGGFDMVRGVLLRRVFVWEDNVKVAIGSDPAKFEHVRDPLFASDAKAPATSFEARGNGFEI